MQKIVLVIFGDISESKDKLHLTHLHNELYHEFKELTDLRAVFCLESSIKDEIVNEFFNSSGAKLASGLIKLGLKKRERKDLELAFEKYVIKRLSSYDYDCVVTTRMAFPRLIDYVHASGQQIGGIATIFPKDYVNKRVALTANLIEYSEKSYYNDKSGVEDHIYALRNSNFVIPGTPNNQAKDVLSGYNKQILITSNVYAPPMDVFLSNFKKQNPNKIVFLTTTQNKILKKGTHVLLHAWKKLLDNLQYQQMIELNILGYIDDEMKQAFDKICDSSTIRYHGQVNNIEQHYMSADVFIASSIVDMGPRTVRQTIQCCLPSIVSDGCGMSDHIQDGKNGFVYDGIKPEALFAVLQRVVTNPDILKEIRNNLLGAYPISMNTKLYVQEIIKYIEER